jgi:hypothetical protein
MNDTDDNSASQQQTDPGVPPLPPPPATIPEDTQPYLAGYLPPKSPPLAAFLAMILGLGHLYTGSYKRAVVIVSSFGLAIYLLPGWQMKVFVPLFVYFFSIFDAYREAQLANLGADSDSLPVRAPAGGPGFGLFVTATGIVLLVDRFYPIEDFLESIRLESWWPAILIVAGLYLVYASYRERTQEQPHE